MNDIQQVAMVLGAAESFPRIAIGHGSRRRRKKCNVPGCSERQHYQNPTKVALAHFEEQGFNFSRNARMTLNSLEEE